MIPPTTAYHEDQLAVHLAHEVHPFVDKDEYFILTLQAFISGNVMQIVDWLWDFRRKKKVYPKNKEDLSNKYFRTPPPSLYEESKNEEINNVTKEELDNGEWARLEDLGDGTIMLTFNVKDDGGLSLGESIPSSIGSEGVTRGDDCASLCKEVDESTTLTP